MVAGLWLVVKETGDIIVPFEVYCSEKALHNHQKINATGSDFNPAKFESVIRNHAISSIIIIIITQPVTYLTQIKTLSLEKKLATINLGAQH